MSNRTPPAAIRRELRKEVNYGCPLCGSPFLTYHHFDPPWEPNHKHIKSGMIALCPTHHDQADGKCWTKTELRQLKYHPLSKEIDGQLNWNLCNSLFIIGNNYVVGDQVIFRVLGTEIIRLRQDNCQRVMLNSRFEDADNKTVFQIIDNDILLLPYAISDFICSTRTNDIYIALNDNKSFLNISFNRKSLDDIKSIIPFPEIVEPLCSLLSENCEDNSVPVIKVTCRLFTKLIDINCTDEHLILGCEKIGYDSAKLNGRVFTHTGNLQMTYSSKGKGDFKLFEIGNE